VTIFTRERGKLDAVAKGVRRMRSHLAGRLELANECAFLMHRGRSLDIIVSAETLSAPWPTLVEPDRYAVVSLMAETIDAFCEPELALPEVYDLLVRAIGSIAASADPRGLLPRFSLRLLHMLGLAPPLDCCVHCGSTLPAGSAWLDAEAGGFTDGACRERWRDLAELTVEDLVNLRALAVPKGSGPAAALHATPAAAHAIAELVAHHLGRRPKAVAYLGGLGA
jgi:DNA repair protein RecO (recombination protein O)